jgi:hypothetical protein
MLLFPVTDKCTKRGSDNGYSICVEYEQFADKLRASHAKVVKIQCPTVDNFNQCYSGYKPEFTYEVGKTVTPDNFDTDEQIKCASGIHFYLTLVEAAAHR